MDIKELISRCARVFYVARKPTDAEFRKVAKISAIGIIIIGLVGIVISAIFGLIG